jgi:hypothetical protein
LAGADIFAVTVGIVIEAALICGELLQREAVHVDGRRVFQLARGAAGPA